MKPINLRQAKKRLERAKKQTQAAENAARHGLTKLQKQTHKEQTLKLQNFVDQRKLDE